MPAGPNCVDTYEEAFLAGTVPAGYCPIHEVTISDVIGSGVSQTGRGIGSAVRGIGRFFGGVFGGDDNDDDREDRVPEPEAR
jgi:hypothetical protein